MSFFRTPDKLRLIPAIVSIIIASAGGAAAQQSADLGPIAQLLLKKQYAQAESSLLGIMPAHEHDAETHIMLAYTLFREDKPAESLQEYTQAAKLRRPSAAGLKWVALDYVLLHDYRDADKWMTQSVAIDPQDEEAWYSLGRIHYTENRFKEAELCFRHALALVPRDVRAENNLGLTYEALYGMKDAVAAYRQAIAWQQDSSHPNEQPYINLAIVLMNQNQLQEALTLLERANQIAPDDPRIRTQLARADYLLGRYSEAEGELDKVLSVSPKDPALHFQLGRVLRKEGKMTQAEAEFARAAVLNGTHSSPHP